MDAGTMMLVGQGVQAGARVGSGISAQRAGAYNASALEAQAPQEIAAAQRTAIERRLETDRLISRQVAQGAASGAGFGPSLLDVIGDTAQQGEYRAQAEQYQGEERARGLRDRARIARWEGGNALTGAIVEGIGGLALGAGRYRQQYGASTTTSPIGPWRTSVTYG